MALLFLLPFVVFIATLLAISLAAIAETAGRKTRGVDASIYGFSILRTPETAQFEAISIGDAFNPEGVALWQTQIPALESIRAAGAQGLPINNLRIFYARSVRHFPELYEGSSFKAWLRFLEEAQLIIWAGSSVRITGTGTEFLECRISADDAVGSFAHHLTTI